MSKPRIYIAGPYTGENIRNMRAAVDAAEWVIELGGWPYVPHLSGLWDFASPHPYEYWMALDLAFLPVCDALFRLPGESSGADREVDIAVNLGIPILNYYGDNLEKWIEIFREETR